MANGTIGFFEPTSPITVPACWTFQDGGAVQHQKTRDNDLGANGDEIRSALHDGKTTTSFVYIFKQPSTPVQVYSFPKPGSVSGGFHIDNFTCKWDRSKASAVLTVNCHKHDTNPHASGDCRTYTPSLAEIPVVPFGCPSTFGAAFELDQQAVVDLRTATYTCGCTHLDETGRTGEQLKGNNHDGAETLAVELTGAATADDYTSTWDMPSDGKTPSNTGVTTSAFSFEHHLQADIADDEE